MCVEPGLPKCPEQFCRRKESELVNFASVSSTAHVSDLVLKKETRDASLNLRATHSRHADPVRFAIVPYNPSAVERAGRKPGLDDHDAARCQVITETCKRPPYSVKRAEISDRTE